MKVIFKTTQDEARIIKQIVERACESSNNDFLDMEMDIRATHLNGCPLELQRLLEADDFNFGHDIYGIKRHLNRTNGKLENCFLPRYAKKQITA